MSKSRIFFGKIFPLYEFKWKGICTLQQKVTINAYLRSFQYKILNTVLYLNKNCVTLVYLTHIFQNGRRENQSPILLLPSYARYLESSPALYLIVSFFHS